MIVRLRKATLSDFVKTEIVNRRLKANRPCSVLIYGESGAGKSVLSLIISLLVKQHTNSSCDVLNHFVYTPNDFFAVFEHVKACDLPVFAVQEVVSFAPTWIPFFKRDNPAVKIYASMVVSRQVKPLLFMICAQNPFDLFKRIRQRFDFAIEVIRYVDWNGKQHNPIAKLQAPVFDLNSIEFEPIHVLTPSERIRNAYFSIPWLKSEILKKFEEIDRERKLVYLNELFESKSKKKAKKEESEQIEAFQEENGSESEQTETEQVTNIQLGKEYYTVYDLAKKLGTYPAIIYKLVKAGLIKTKTVKKKKRSIILIPRDEYERAVSKLKPLY